MDIPEEGIAELHVSQARLEIALENARAARTAMKTELDAAALTSSASTRQLSKLSVTKWKQRVQVVVDNIVIADTRNALSLKVSNEAPLLFVPLADVNMDYLVDLEEADPTEPMSKSYYSVQVRLIPASHTSLAHLDFPKIPGRRFPNAVFFYRNPFPEVTAIANHLNFSGMAAEDLASYVETVERKKHRADDIVNQRRSSLALMDADISSLDVRLKSLRDKQAHFLADAKGVRLSKLPRNSRVRFGQTRT
jgi:uncharacterized protein (DUF427 family)